MDSIHIYGGIPLEGCVPIQGSKNAALPIMAAALLVKGTCVIDNCPRITDVLHMGELLRELGCVVERKGKRVVIDASQVMDNDMEGEAVTGMRSSIMLLGAMLSRCGEAEMAYPGGCVIGKRPIDLHLEALRRMGVEIREEKDCFTARTSGLKGMDYCLPIPSVGATENIILAAVLAEGVTRLRNAAAEPEIVALCGFLNAAGADIAGAGTPFLRIRGVRSLHEVVCRVEADRIVAGTYLAGALAAGGDVYLEGAVPGQMRAMLCTAGRMGADIRCDAGGIRVRRSGPLRAVSLIRTECYPGFPTDMQSPFMAALALADGDSIIEERIFENRFRIVEDLNRMGANITVVGDRAYIHGVERLYGKNVTAQELRGGAALAVAGLGAEGETVIDGIQFIERGYEDICSDLRCLGAMTGKERHGGR